MIVTTKVSGSPYRTYFYILLIATTIFRLLYTGLINLSPDEAYYWNWSRHLDLSYYDHPPMVAYVIYLTTFFNTINTELFVRAGAALMGSGMSVIAFFMARDIFESEAAGFWAAVWFNIILVFSLGALIITPDTPQAFFLLLFIYILYKAIFHPYQYNFYLAGVFLGCAYLSKYTSFLLVPSVMLFLLLSKSKRYLLKDRKIYIMLIISFAVFTPVLLWNVKHNWISFSFQLSHGFKGNFGEMFFNVPEFIGSQVALLTPFVFLGIILTFFYCGKMGIKENDDKLLFLFCTSAPIILFFLLVSANSKVEGNWPAFGYLSSVVALGGLTATYKEIFVCSKKIKFLKNLKWASFVSAVTILLAAHIFAAFPVRVLFTNTSFTRRLIGWQELGAQVGMIVSDMGEENTFIFGNRHQIISEISFYTDKKYETYQKGGYGRYPYLKDLEYLKGKNAVYVAEEGRSEYKHVKKFFHRMVELKPVDVLRGGEKVRRFQIYKCFNYKGGLINV